MKKLILLFVCTMLLASVAEAKSNKKKIIQFGVKAGAMYSSMNFPSTSLADYSLSAEGEVGYQFGVVTKLNILFLHLQPELLYTMNRYSINMSDEGNSSSTKIKQNTFDVPIIFGYHLFFFNINVGPVFTLTNATSLSGDASVIENILAAKPLVGYTAGISVEIKKFVIDARYNGYFKKTEQAITIDDKSATINLGQSNYIFSLGYLF